MRKIILNFINKLFLLSLLSSFSNAWATPQEEVEAKRVVGEFYSFNVYEHNCSSLKKGVTKSYAHKVLHMAGDNFPEKSHHIYDWKTKPLSFWEEFFNKFYVTEIANEYAMLCSRNYVKKSNEEIPLSDLRFPYMFDEDASFQISTLIFGDIKSMNDELIVPTTIYLLNKAHFTKTYVLHRTKNGLRIFDIIEENVGTDNDEKFVSSSLQMALKSWRNRLQNPSK